MPRTVNLTLTYEKQDEDPFTNLALALEEVTHHIEDHRRYAGELLGGGITYVVRTKDGDLAE